VNPPYTLVSIALVFASLLAFAGCEDDVPATGNPALPEGIAETRLPSGEANAFIYIDPPSTAGVPAELLSSDSDTSADEVDLEAEGLEGLMLDLGGDYAVRVRFASSGEAGSAAPRIEKLVQDEAHSWTETIDRSVLTGRAAGQWGTDARESWTSGTREAVADQFPDFWAQLRRMPEEPPSPPVAAGFVRNVGDLPNRLFRAAGVEVPGLAEGLTLVRVSSIVFVAYSGGLGELPSHLGSSLLEDLNTGILAVADSSYPSLVVGQVFDSFVGALGLSEVTLEGETAYYREIDADLHLVVMRNGSALFFAVGATREYAEGLVSSVERR
jgi:hypothetical protein